MAHAPSDTPAWGLANVARSGVGLGPRGRTRSTSAGPTGRATERVPAVRCGLRHRRRTSAGRWRAAQRRRDRRRGRPNSHRQGHGGRRERPWDRVRASSASSRPGASSGACACSGRTLGGTGAALVGGLEWAIDAGYDVINLSLSTRRRTFAEQLRELADRAYFRGALLVSVPTTCPWRASHGGSRRSCRSLRTTAQTALEVHYNPRPAGRVLRPWSGRARRLAGRGLHPCDGQLVRHPACERHLRAHPRRASDSHAVSGQEPAVPDGCQRPRPCATRQPSAAAG